MRRRAFLQGALAMPAGAATPMQPLDYGRSFLSGVAQWNSVRFWVESRTRFIDERSGQAQDYLQCASCKSEDTFARANLFYADNNDFLPVFGPAGGVIFRRKAAAHAGYRDVRPAAKMWDGQKLQLVPARGARLLGSTVDIRKATHAGAPLVAQTELRDATTGLRAIIEFPVKTINIHDEKDLYQVDTGPIALPDLSRRYDRAAESLSLAFIAFNAPDWADFVIETETPLPRGGGPVYHYSKLLHHASANRLYRL